MNELSRYTNLPKGRLKLAITIALALGLSCLYSATAQTLVWEEDFNAATVNTNQWTYDFGDGSGRAAGLGWGNSELEYYTSRNENVRIESGSLVIEARKEAFGNSAFTSGRIKTEGRVHFKYGTVEARIKLPNMANGLWPAFWTLGTIGGSWPSIGEIDIMEAGSASGIQAGLANKRVSSATHWSDAGGAHQYNTSSTDAAVDLSLDYHLYKVVWTSQHIKMYLDNVEFYTFDISAGAAANLSEFHNPHFLLLNLAVGGNYTNIFDPNAITAPLPGKMYVDYIKLYQNPGDELTLGTNTAITGNFGVLTETTTVSDFLTIGTNATLNYWNNITNITNPAPVPFEGTNLWAVHANAGDWFGMGLVNNYVNLANFSAGSLKFHYKSTYAGQFKIGLTTGHGETWINFGAGVQKYGLVRDGNWHEVTIPMADFDNPGAGMNIDLLTLKSAFMFAGDPAIAGADFYFDNVYFYNAPVVVLTDPITAAPTPLVRASGDVISLFSDAYTNVTVDFAPSTWGQSTVTEEVLIQGDKTKKYTAWNYQGMVTSATDLSAMNKLHLDVWSPDCTDIEVYLLGPGEPKVTKTLVQREWNSIDIDLSAYGISLASITGLKLNGIPFDYPVGNKKGYIDNVYFYNAPVVVLTDPIIAAPTPPVRASGDVISLFSDAYTNVSVDFAPPWGQSTVTEEVLIQSNKTKKYTAWNYQGMVTSATDLSAMTKLHLDVWSPDCTDIEVYILGPGEPKVTKTLVKSEWNSIDIDLSAYGISLASITGLKLNGIPFDYPVGNKKGYIDNVYFYKAAGVVLTDPITAAPTPPARASGDVISLFSDAYTNVSVDFAPPWGQSTVTEEVLIQSNKTKKFTAWNYQGMVTAATDLSAMTKLHLDVWSPDCTEIEVYLLGPGEPKVTKTLVKSEWNSIDIDLSDYGISLASITGLKLNGIPFDYPVGNKKGYIDNVYFYRPAGSVIGQAPSVSITSPSANAQFIEPASITINATAADADGTVTQVEFFNGTTLLGTDNTSPYSFDWNNVAAGNYSITAKVTDNDGNVVTSSPAVAIAVKPVPCTGTAVSGDYSYEVYTQAGSVYFTFHPLAPITGSNLAILNLKEGGGAYTGYGMTASGADFIISRPIANGINTSFYFTYNTPPAGERNSSADPHSYYVGMVCVPGAPTVSITSPLEAASFMAPATITINATAADDGTVTSVDFYEGANLLGTDNTSPYSFDWTNVAAGNYALTAKATDNTTLSTTSTPVNVVVNAPNLNGFCGTAVSGDYEYKAETSNGIVTFRLHPLTPIDGCLYAILNVTTPTPINANMIQSGTDFIYSTPIADGTLISFYFTYNTPPGGERNSSANKHNYTVGTNCMGISGTTPLVSITSPLINASFTELATVTINATASDNDGTVSKVDFYSGATLLGMDDTSPYSFDWTNVPAGNYIVSARATDNDGYTTISNLVDVVVNINNSGGFCGTLANGDYSYKAETIGGNVVISFHPETPIAGCNSSLIYIREGLTGGYPGYPMTKIGTDFRFTKAIADGTPISIYFTYNTPPGGERNSSATPHSYTVGDVCLGGAPTVSITSPANAASYSEPANITITATAADGNGTIAKVEFFNGTTLLGMDDTAPYSFDWNNIPAGAYTLRAKATDNSALLTTSAPVNITVNAVNLNGYCGTAVGGDYEYRAETVGANVVFTFHPLAPIAGCNLAILYLQEGGGGFPGYSMAASGTDFVFTKAIANGVALSFYFTYNTPPAGERNSSANPHSYTVGAVCFTALPVNLITFAASKQADGKVAVTWSTASEQNNDHFLVEKSTDGRLFTAFAKVAGNNFSSNKTDYKVLDNSPASGRNYYRLSQVDKDGKSVSFGIKTVNINRSNGSISVYPNPLTGSVINIKLAEPAVNKVQVQLLSIAGKVMFNGSFVAQGDALQILLPGKPADGIYLLKVANNAPIKLVVN